MIGFVSCPVLHNTQQWSRRNNIATKTIFRAHKIITTVLGHKRRAAHRAPTTHPPTYLYTYLHTRRPSVRLSGAEMTQRRKKPTKRSLGACVHDEKSRIWVIVVWDARAKIKHIGMRRHKLWPVISLPHSLARSPSFPSSVHNTNTHKHICARMCVCVFVCGVRPPLFARARLHFSAAYLLHDVFIQSTSPLGSRSRTRHTRTHTQARAVSRPPSLRVQKTTQAAAASECSTNVLCELATYTHTHTHTHDDDDLWRNPLPEANAIIKNKIHTTCTQHTHTYNIYYIYIYIYMSSWRIIIIL